MLTVLVFLLWRSSITMESQNDWDFQTAVSTQSQMCTSPFVVQNINQTLYSSPHWKIPTKHCKISTKHWESIQVHKLQFCSHFSTAGEWWGCSELHIHFYWKYFHKTCFQSAWDDQPRSSDFSCKSNWMFCKIKIAPSTSFVPSQRSGMFAVRLLQTLHMLFYNRLPD